MTYLPGTALLTGAASGIGKGVAHTFAEEGCTKLFLGDVNLPGLERARNEIHKAYPHAEVEVCSVDITNESSVQSFIDGCVMRFGRIDYAVNVAGIVPIRRPIAELEVGTFDSVVNVNQTGTWLCHRSQIRQMMEQDPLPGYGNIRGSIVSISSLAGLNASAGMSTYSSSKFGIIGFAKTDAQDYGPYGIRVNVISPGMTDTELFRKTTPSEAVPMLEAITPLRRLGSPRDIGLLSAWLSSEKASFVQGVVVPCDGGLGLQRGVI